MTFPRDQVQKYGAEHPLTRKETNVALETPGVCPRCKRTQPLYCARCSQFRERELAAATDDQADAQTHLARAAAAAADATVRCIAALVKPAADSFAAIGRDDADNRSQDAPAQAEYPGVRDRDLADSVASRALRTQPETNAPAATDDQASPLTSTARAGRKALEEAALGLTSVADNIAAAKTAAATDDQTSPLTQLLATARAAEEAAHRVVQQIFPPIPGETADHSFEPPLDAKIKEAVIALRMERVETYESCEGGPFHAFSEPTVRFHGDREEGFRALAVALRAGLHVVGLRRFWDVIEGEPTGPEWEMTFFHMPDVIEAPDE